jgi:hypothetical protein
LEKLYQLPVEREEQGRMLERDDSARELPSAASSAQDGGSRLG